MIAFPSLLQKVIHWASMLVDEKSDEWKKAMDIFIISSMPKIVDQSFQFLVRFCITTS